MAERDVAPLCECGCGQPAPVIRRSDFARGRIKGGYSRFVARHATSRTTPNLDGKFVVIDSGCWEWRGVKSPGGYGRVWLQRKRVMAHRASYELHVGPVPEGMCLDHLCRNRACINPEHLEPVTTGENVRRGLLAKLTWAEVQEIRASATPSRELAARFGVSVIAIQQARNGRTWGTP